MQIWRYAADQAEQMAGTRQEGMGDIENSYRSAVAQDIICT